jgi:hypothetical protein
MTFRLTLISAAILFSANVALASPGPTNSDEARAMAGRLLLAPRAVVAATALSPASTDEARALAGRTQPSASPRSVIAIAGGPTSTDEARGLAGSAIRAAPVAGEHKGTMACQRSCACNHGRARAVHPGAPREAPRLEAHLGSPSPPH